MAADHDPEVPRRSRPHDDRVTKKRLDQPAPLPGPSPLAERPASGSPASENPASTPEHQPAPNPRQAQRRQATLMGGLGPPVTPRSQPSHEERRLSESRPKTTPSTIAADPADEWQRAVTLRADAREDYAAVSQPAAGDGGRPATTAGAVLGNESAPSGAVLGRYQLLFELARGGMGVVHVARLRGAHGFDRMVAIKQLTVEHAGEEAVAAFLAEARVSAKINHPNVVPTLELGEHDGAPFLVMELVEGVSLARLVERLAELGELMPPHLTAWIGSQVAGALHAAHELCDDDGESYGLVHRDVSHENVLLSYAGRVYVADFGVAKFAGPERRQTRSGVVKGKFAYMSPEQTEAGALDRRSDVFSLGIVLHECLTGQPLFEGRSAAETIRRIWSVDPPDPRNIQPDVSERMATIVSRCLEKAVDQRYATAGEVAHDLRQLLRQESAAIDESDLARLLERCFPEGRAELKRRIRDALRGEPARKSDAAPVHESSSDSAPVWRSSVTASVTTSPPLAPRRYAGAWALAVAALVAGGGVWLVRATQTTDEPAAASATPSASATTVALTSEVAPSASGGEPAPSASATTTASAPQPLPRGPAHAGAPPSPRTSAPRASTPPPPSPTPSSAKGIPFPSLGP
jgi:serine/threonine-protein kinase